MTEIWIDIKGYEEQYQVSNLGNVKRKYHKVKISSYTKTSRGKFQKYKDSYRIQKELIMKFGQDQDGYLLVGLKCKTFKVHRLVAQHFIENPYQYPDVKHKDGNFENNHFENLEWINTELTKEEKHECKIKYEKEYRKKDKRKSWFHARLKTQRYIDHITKIETRFKRAVNHSHKRNLKFTLNLEQYKELLSKNCYYCDKSIKEESGVSLDRIDNSKDYNIENVLTCCGNCNIIRGNKLTVEEMKVAMNAILEFRKYGNKVGLKKREDK